MLDGDFDLSDYLDNLPHHFAVSVSEDQANVRYLFEAISLFKPEDGVDIPMNFTAFLRHEPFLRERAPDIQWGEYVRYLCEILSRWQEAAKRMQRRRRKERGGGEQNLQQYLMDEARSSRDG